MPREAQGGPQAAGQSVGGQSDLGSAGSGRSPRRASECSAGHKWLLWASTPGTAPSTASPRPNIPA
eukprot:scaffold116331_cov31-Prasinocladus_malaysianus.AAC.1